MGQMTWGLWPLTEEWRALTGTFRFRFLLTAVLSVEHKEVRVEERPVWRLFQLSRQKIMMVRIRGNSTEGSGKWPDCGCILKVGPKNILIP